MSLRPRNIIQAAEADLKRRARNVKRDYGSLDGGFEQYAFYAPHVRRAHDDVIRLLTLALKYGVPKTVKKNTLMIYGDQVLLRAALDEAFNHTEQQKETF